MIKTPETSRLFTRWRNPSNGVESFVLTGRVAPAQQTFYYTSPGFTDDGRYLWLSVAWPPPGGRHAAAVLAVVDFERDELRFYPETQHPTARPAVDLASGEVYWGNDADLWKRGPLPEDKAVRVARFPADLARGRKPERLATHLFFSPDRKSLIVDARFGGQTFIGDQPLDGSPPRIWESFQRYHNHAQFSPTDPDTILMAYEYWKEPENGPFNGQTKYHRLWLAHRHKPAEPLLREPVSHSGHEWFAADGKSVYYVHYGVGIKQVDLATRAESLVWPGRLSHGYSDRTGRYLTADWMDTPHRPDCIVYFYDTQTKKQIEIVNRGPLADDATQITHLHPHPHFCLGDRYVCHTTTVYDRVDLALAPTAPLIAACGA